MSNYIFTYYHSGKMPESPEEGAKHMAKWNDWVAELGDTLVEPNNSLGKFKIVSSDSVSDREGSDAMMRFSTVKADNLDAALDIAKGCPFLEMGTIEVAEMKEM